MRKCFFVLAIAVLPIPAEAVAQCGVPLRTLVDEVEASLENLRDLSAEFVQFQSDPLNRNTREEGHVYLRRPRMMRWEYRSPEEKLFVVNGDTMYTYAPADRQVSRDRVDESFDDRVPIMFLLGRSDLESEFAEIVNVPDVEVANTCGMMLTPRRESDVETVLLEVDSETFDIRRLRLSSFDGSISEFVFDAVQTNRNLDEELFDFVPPPGIRVVEGF